MFKNQFKTALTGFALSTLLASGTAYATQIDLSQSTVSVTGKQLGVPVEGQFKKLNGVVNFNAAQPAQSNVNIVIVVGSYDMGLPDYNKNVLGAEWFDTAKFPNANFVSNSVKVINPTSYLVTGKFTLKGRTQTVTVPVAEKTVGANQVFDGVFTIKRSSFAVGTGEWADTSIVADDVDIKFHIVVPTGSAAPAKGAAPVKKQ